jgi:hypothetical protein
LSTRFRKLVKTQKKNHFNFIVHHCRDHHNKVSTQIYLISKGSSDQSPIKKVFNLKSFRFFFSLIAKICKFITFFFRLLVFMCPEWFNYGSHNVIKRVIFFFRVFKNGLWHVEGFKVTDFILWMFLSNTQQERCFFFACCSSWIFCLKDFYFFIICALYRDI